MLNESFTRDRGCSMHMFLSGRRGSPKLPCRILALRALQSAQSGPLRSFDEQRVDVMTMLPLRAMVNRESPLRGLRSIAPYVAIEVLLPGGSLIALATWLYRRRRAIQHVHDQSAT
jgi:hypothetical protein